MTQDMETRLMKMLSLTLAATAGLLLAPAAMAVTTYVMPSNQLPGACTQQSANANTYGNTYACAAEGSYDYTVDVKAYAASSGANFAAAHVADWTGGFGVQNRGEGLNASSPQHGTDNDGRLDLLMFSFDASFALSEVMIGWPASGYDTDISILAWTGGGDPTAALTSSTEGNLLSTGWDLVGNYTNLDDGVARGVNAAAVSSSYWIVSAFSRYGAASGGDTTKDYFKLYSIAGTRTCTNSTMPSCGSTPGTGTSVPEPASLALVAVALAGGVAGSRRGRRRG
jgi:hypothetical protein